MPIRIRLAIAFALATLVLFGVSGLLFERSFRHGVETSLDPGLRSQRDSLVRDIRAAGPGLGLGADTRAGVLPTHDVVAQVLDSTGRVIQATQEAGRRRVISRQESRRARRGSVFTKVAVGLEHEPYRVLASPFRSADGERIVIVATSLEAADAAVTRVRQALLIGGGVAVVLAALGAWVLAAAALRPVERMRREAAEISEHDSSAQLRVPTTRDEIAALGSTMNALLARLQGALSRQRAFVADAGHELRTPLAVLRMELEMAARPDRTPDELRDAIAHAGKETERLARLADELLLLARADDDRGAPQRELVLLAPVLQRSADSMRPLADERAVNVVVVVDRAIIAPMVADLMRQAVENLLTNALRYSSTGSTVTVRARVQRSDVVIEVLDEGPGFPPELLSEAFVRFRRADDARSRADGGAGLGLAIVLAVAQAHGGTAVAANRPGRGAVVTMTIAAEM